MKYFIFFIITLFFICLGYEESHAYSQRINTPHEINFATPNGSTPSLKHKGIFKLKQNVLKKINSLKHFIIQHLKKPRTNFWYSVLLVLEIIGGILLFLLILALMVGICMLIMWLLAAILYYLIYAPILLFLVNNFYALSIINPWWGLLLNIDFLNIIGGIIDVIGDLF
jgi:hypothetical protein